VSVIWLLAGGAIGALQVASVRWAVLRLRPRAARQALFAMLGGSVLRSVLVAAALAVAFRQGLVPGGLALSGMLLGRWMAIWRLCADRRQMQSSPLEVRG
jgi:hypothetical protein